MRHPIGWVVFSISLMLLTANGLRRGAPAPDEIGMPAFSEKPHSAAQNLLIAVRTTEWHTDEAGLLDVSALAPPLSPGSMIDGATLAEALTDPQAFAYLPALAADRDVIPVAGAVLKRTTSVSPSSR
jgi:hypothetical protein